MLQRFKQWLRGGKAATFLERPEGIPISQLRDYDSYLEAGSKKIWATYKSCDLVGTTIQNVPWRLADMRDNEVNIRPLVRLFTFPNRWETFAEFLYKLACHRKLTGDAFILKSEVNANGNRPRELFALNPKHIRIVPDHVEKIQGYIYRTPRGDIPLEPDEVIHIKKPHPNNEYWGIGDIEAGESLFNEHINRNTRTEKFWKNGAAPSGILSYKREVFDQKEWEDAKREFRRQYGGIDNAGKTAMLSGEWNYQQLGMTASEMQDIERSRWTIHQIFHMHGVPLSMVGIEKAANYATAKRDERNFRRYTVLPELKLIQDSLNTDLVAGFRDDITFQFVLGGLIPLGEIVEDLSPAFDRGLLSINEFREQLGFPRIEENPNFDQHYINSGLVPVDLAGAANLDDSREAARAIQQDFIRSSLQGGGSRREEQNEEE